MKMHPFLVTVLVATISTLLGTFYAWIHKKIWGPSNFDIEKDKYTKKEYVAQIEKTKSFPNEIIEQCECLNGKSRKLKEFLYDCLEKDLLSAEQSEILYYRYCDKADKLPFWRER